MAATNWVGQEIKPGDIVWRGARNGNLTECKIGRVLDAEPGRVRVQWVFRNGAYRDGTEWKQGAVSTSQISAAGIDTVVVIDPSTLAPELQEGLAQ